MNLKSVFAALLVTVLSACSDSPEKTTDAPPVVGLTPAQENAETLTALMHPAAYFQAGSLMATKQVVVYFDAQCPHCGTLWNELRPLSESGKLSAKWAPVKFLSPLSMAQGVTLVKSENPVQAMTKHESLLKTATRGIPVDKAQVDRETISKIELNTKKMNRNKQQSVPALFISRRNGSIEKYEGPLDAALILSWVGRD